MGQGQQRRREADGWLRACCSFCPKDFKLILAGIRNATAAAAASRRFESHQPTLPTPTQRPRPIQDAHLLSSRIQVSYRLQLNSELCHSEPEPAASSERANCVTRPQSGRESEACRSRSRRHGSVTTCDVTAACVLLMQLTVLSLQRTLFKALSRPLSLCALSSASTHSPCCTSQQHVAHTPRGPNHFETSLHRLIFNFLFRYIVALCLQLLQLICNLFIAYLYVARSLTLLPISLFLSFSAALPV